MYVPKLSWMCLIYGNIYYRLYRHILQISRLLDIDISALKSNELGECLYYRWIEFMGLGIFGYIFVGPS